MTEPGHLDLWPILKVAARLRRFKMAGSFFSARGKDLGSFCSNLLFSTVFVVGESLAPRKSPSQCPLGSRLCALSVPHLVAVAAAATLEGASALPA